MANAGEMMMKAFGIDPEAIRGQLGEAVQTIAAFKAQMDEIANDMRDVKSALVKINAGVWRIETRLDRALQLPDDEILLAAMRGPELIETMRAIEARNAADAAVLAAINAEPTEREPAQ
jgi:hypothetical protein